MSLDAGGNGLGLGPASRGFSFIPEVSDSVLVSFLDGQQLSQPVIIGSMFHGANAASLGGGKGNHIKSILTRSGHTIEFITAFHVFFSALIQEEATGINLSFLFSNHG
jgi:uncharacterized protein involved in type VI secretion and phage assembly